MKYFKLNALLFTSLFLSLLFAACDKEVENNDDNTTQNSFSSKVLSGKEFENLAGHYERNDLFLQGKFKLAHPNENQLVFYTETSDTKHIFLFHEIQPNLLDKDVEIDKLYYLKNGILLNNEIFLGTDGNRNTLLKKDLKKFSATKSLKEFNGAKMLVHKWFSKKDPNFKDIGVDELITTMAESLATVMHEGDCDSGGEGSTGCGLGGGSTGCEVSCGAGYYACCVLTAIGPNDCHCHKNGS